MGTWPLYSLLVPWYPQTSGLASFPLLMTGRPLDPMSFSRWLGLSFAQLLAHFGEPHLYAPSFGVLLHMLPHPSL